MSKKNCLLGQTFKVFCLEMFFLKYFWKESKIISKIGKSIVTEHGEKQPLLQSRFLVLNDFLW